MKYVEISEVVAETASLRYRLQAKGGVMKDSRANQLVEMLKTGQVNLVVNGVTLGKAKVVSWSKADIETYPPIETVNMALQFPRT